MANPFWEKFERSVSVANEICRCATIHKNNGFKSKVIYFRVPNECRKISIYMSLKSQKLFANVHELSLRPTTIDSLRCAV